ncbi:MAG: STAS/SEC14 domain-containing protein [Sulfuricurvum sp.]|nr:STAS/SEC14 domain-containing protein [Sulfuricurvum sp.]
MNDHAISIAIEQNGNDILMKMKIVGKLKHSDYEMIIPLMDDAIAGVKNPQIKVLVDLIEFSGYELQALWDDFKFGVKYNKEFSKIAAVGNKRWEETGIKIANWFTHAEMKYFESPTEALEWISAH